MSSTAPTRARILVVEDDQRIAASLRRALLYEGYQVDLAADGPAALRAVLDRMPDMVILDVMLPGIDGVEVCRRLRTDSGLPILMLTARDSTADRVQGLDSGADDYLVKPFAYEELLARVRAMLRRGPPHRARTLRFADVTLDLAAIEARRGDRKMALTATELELLRRFLENPRTVPTRDQLLEAVWGLDADTSSNVVDVYVGYLRQKLEDGGGPRLILSLIHI